VQFSSIFVSVSTLSVPNIVFHQPPISATHW
jgi:hypothetical protein